jgi:hypothetical protein
MPLRDSVLFLVIVPGFPFTSNKGLVCKLSRSLEFLSKEKRAFVWLLSWCCLAINNRMYMEA